jgi:phospho-N-acetylmuramoyl-pentapeptide-transferase
MLYHLFYSLVSEFSGFNVVRYITFRTAAATLTAMFLAFLLGPGLIRALGRLRVGQPIREIGPDHHSKAGTPTMGGLLILVSLLVSVLLWSNLTNRLVWIVTGVTAAYGLLGFIDDYRKVRQRDNEAGLSARAKLGWQLLIAVAVGLAIYHDPSFDKELSVPFFKYFTPHLGALYVPLAALVIVGTSNAVNLTDGLDGLAIGPVMIAAGTFLLLSYAAGHAGIADYLAIKHVQGSGQLAIFCGALVGGGLGFLWFNSYPAQLFMGDVGSLALGGALGTIAVLIRQEILLAVVGGIFVLEACSVIIQVAWFKLTGERVFLMAPIHHHFEKQGWPEQKIVVRFWIVSVILALVALSSLKLR